MAARACADAIGSDGRQSFVEEVANSLTHGVGLAASLAAVPILVLAAMSRGDAWDIAGAAVFAASLVLLYAASTLYHALPDSAAKRVMRVVDHSAIYLLIAGTYTPFTLGALRGAWGWTLFGLVWALAVSGIVFKTTCGLRFPRLSTVFYLAMGWLCVIALRPLVTQVPGPGLAWIAAGGLLYSGGVAFYAWHRMRFHHALWHLCVLAGSTCHFFAVLWYAA